VLHHYIAVLNI